MSRLPNLLLTFDAFGTLFRPKASPAQQYAHVARQLGLAGFRDDDLHASLARAFKAEAKQHPNYGKASGLGATRWWANVIHNTFAPLITQGESLPPDLAPRLMHRFSSREAYSMEPRLVSSLRAVKQKHRRRGSSTSSSSKPFDNVLVGVLTNSDDRVPSILASFGLRVSPLRYGTASGAQDRRTPYHPAGHDIDFHCISYDVGFEKPDGRMFRAAEDMLAQIVAARAEGRGRGGGGGKVRKVGINAREDSETWIKVHVGDERAKDVKGALDAGWNAVLLDEEGRDGSDLPWLEELGDARTIGDLFRTTRAVRLRSLTSLLRWLSRQ